MSDIIPEELLNKCNKLPIREIVIRLVAYLHGYGKRHDTFRKHITKAKKDYPSFSQLWKQGIEMIKSE